MEKQHMSGMGKVSSFRPVESATPHGTQSNYWQARGNAFSSLAL